MKLSKTGYKDWATNIVSLALIGHVIYQYVTGNLTITEFLSQVNVVTELALSIVGVFVKREKKTRNASFTPNQKKS